jgi:hypothetical protein
MASLMKSSNLGSAHTGHGNQMFNNVVSRTCIDCVQAHEEDDVYLKAQHQCK